ncbi:MAG: agmatine deiminase family protein [Xenococcaceae cyanobacterium MO_207.B15]|nr:agmatine deiminase family protein [Xenococcaceae cyanobacterium MO_207.B15]
MNLIPDWQCPRVILVLPTVFMKYYDEHLKELELFYADFLREIARYDRVICLVSDRANAEKMMQLTNLSNDFFPIAYIEDIWVRDFAPIQSVTSYLKFKFNPSYESKTNNKFIERSFLDFLDTLQINNLEFVDLYLEGGNFIHNGNGTAIITDKIYRQNKLKTPQEIEFLIKDKLSIEHLVIVPTEPGDRTGHIDGMMRWIDSDRLLINDYQSIYPNTKFYTKLNSCLDLQLPDVEKIILPYVPTSTKHKGWYSAVGNYINYLRTQNQVYIPIFGNSIEPEIKRIYKQIFNNQVSFIPSNAIAKYGGLLNCISWNYN